MRAAQRHSKEAVQSVFFKKSEKNMYKRSTTLSKKMRTPSKDEVLHLEDSTTKMQTTSLFYTRESSGPESKSQLQSIQAFESGQRSDLPCRHGARARLFPKLNGCVIRFKTVRQSLQNVPQESLSEKATSEETRSRTQAPQSRNFTVETDNRKATSSTTRKRTPQVLSSHAVPACGSSSGRLQYGKAKDSCTEQISSRKREDLARRAEMGRNLRGVRQSTQSKIRPDGVPGESRGIWVQLLRTVNGLTDGTREWRNCFLRSIEG